MRRLTLFFLLCTPAFLALNLCSWDAEAGSQDAEPDALVQEFNRFYRSQRPVQERIEAIYVLKNADPFQAVQALCKAFDDLEEKVREVVIETIGSFRDPRCVSYLVENYITNRKEKKLQRIVCAVRALGLIGDESALEPMLLLWRRMKHSDFKMAMGLALGNLKSEKALPILYELLHEEDPLLRVIAVDGIAKINNPEALLTLPEESTESSPRCKDALVRILEEDSDLFDSSWQVRASAIAALRKMRFKEAIQPLIHCLRREEGRLKGDAYEALKELTFSQYGEDPDEWQNYWDRVKDKFEIVDINVVLEARRKSTEQGSRYNIATPSFAGIPTKSRNIIFIVDVSKSMGRPVMDTDRYREAGREYKTYARLEIVKDELIRTI
ncbi:MAG: HEAT repeat domain-containing protein, partial [Planctomycetota bacterium]